MMCITRIAPSLMKTSSWSGGKTTELFILPAGADYGARDFDFRISSATVDLPASDFTSLPDYNRFISPLTGHLTLSFSGSGSAAPSTVTLAPGEIASFDGSWSTHSEGMVTDFNLMVRKGLTGSMTALRAGSSALPGSGTILPGPGAILPEPDAMLLESDSILPEPDAMLLEPASSRRIFLYIGCGSALAGEQILTAGELYEVLQPITLDLRDASPETFLFVLELQSPS